MRYLATLLLLAVVALLAAAPASARTRAAQVIVTCDFRTCSDWPTGAQVAPGSAKRTLEVRTRADKRAGRQVRQAARQHYAPATGGTPGGLVRVATAAGPIEVNSGIADRMVGFIAEVWARGFRGAVHCYAPVGHVYMSTHHSGGGCDFAQRARGRTHSVMYRVADVAARWGLRDGCSFRDCGHVDGGSAYNAPPVGGGSRYARRRTHYARAGT